MDLQIKRLNGNGMMLESLDGGNTWVPIDAAINDIIGKLYDMKSDQDRVDFIDSITDYYCPACGGFTRGRYCYCRADD